MATEIYEKFVPVADWFELWAGRHPDYRAENEVRNLKRQGITATYKRLNMSLVLITAEDATDTQIAYLEKRDYLPVRKRKSRLPKMRRMYSDVVQTILARKRNGSGGGIPLTRGEVAMLFLDGHAGDGPGLLDIRSQGYGDDSDWDGLTTEDVLQDEDTAFVWTKWEPLELWLKQCVQSQFRNA